jgi:hypothetical protein
MLFEISMRWMMEILRYLRNSVARNVEERCTLNTIKGYMVMNTESRIGIRVKESGDSVRVSKGRGIQPERRFAMSSL